MVFSPITDDIEKVDAARGGVLSTVAGEDLLAGQLVKLNGNNQVIPSDTDGEQAVGITTQGVAAGDSATVLSISTVANVRAATAVSANDPITSHGGTGEEGEVATADGTGDFIVGMALEDIGSGEYGQAIMTLAGEVN